MTIRVTLQQNGKTTRKEYRTHKSAIRNIKRWFETNSGIAMVYEPGSEPVVYNHAHELPYHEHSQQTDFYSSQAWLALRFKVLNNAKRCCKLCGITPDEGATLHVDHIKARSLYPELALEESNLQILCEKCNKGKMTSESRI
ncbi:HNH endonuclease [Aestuariibacter sp. A3R04]|uniref:HNH endonuclease n=1 Tax=Aestuariibacter sp. A3R04 TaxID=2841571 RepID=UPI001C09AF95|nr:HNH endonuclease signature motif containing protein [Aestuariibacter sp. A3R04]MBU3023823.1 HNH endonuclease [Aestuariibacter sp. A3R04]